MQKYGRCGREPVLGLRVPRNSRPLLGRSGPALEARLAGLHTHGEPSALTQLAHFQDLAQHPGQLDAAAAEGTLVLILSAAVLKHDLQAEKGPVTEGSDLNAQDEGCGERRRCPPAPQTEALGATTKPSSKHILTHRP